MSNQLLITVGIGAVLRAGFATVFGRAQRTSHNLGNEIAHVGRRQERLGQIMARSLARPTANLGRMQQQYARMGQEIERATRAQNRLNSAMAMQESGRLHRQNLRSEMLETSGHAAVLAAPVIHGVRTFMQQEDAATELKITMMRADGTSGAFEELTKQAVNLGKELPGTTKEFYSLGRVLKSQGLSDDMLVNGGLKTSAQLNVLMNMDQAQGGEFFAKLVEARGLKEHEFEKAADLTQRAHFGFGLKKEDLYESMKYNAPTANALGLTGVGNYEKLLAIEGMGAQVGLEGSQFGTNFSQMLNQMAEGPIAMANARSGIKKEAKAIMAASNVEFEFFDKKGKFKGLEGMVSELEKLKKIKAEQGERAAMIVSEQMFGTQAARPAMIIAEKGREGLEANIKLMREQADLQARIATKTSTLSSALEQLGGVGEHLIGTFGSAFADDIKSLAATAQNFIEGTLQPWVEKNKTLIKWTFGLLAGMFAAKIGVLALSYGFSMAVSPLLALLTGGHKVYGVFRLFQLMRFGGISKGVFLFRALGMSAQWAAGSAKAVAAVWSFSRGVIGGFFGFLKSALPFARAFAGGFFGVFKVYAGWAWAGLKLVGAGLMRVIGFLPALAKGILMVGRFFLATPIGLALGLMAAAAYLLYKNWDDVVGGAKLLWQDLSDFFGGLWQQVSAFFNSGIGNIAATILNWSPLGLVYRAWAGVLSWFGIDLPGTLTGAGSLMAQGLALGWQAVVGWVNGIWVQIKTAFNGGLVGIGQLILNWSPLGFFYQAFASVLSWFGVSLPATFTGFGQMILQGLWNGLKAKFEEVKGWFSGVAGWFGSVMQQKNEIKSPSRLFKRFGGFMMEGLQIGLANGAPRPLAAIGGLASNLQQRFTQGAGELRSNLSARMQANSAEFAQARAQQAAAAAAGGGYTIHYSPTINAPGGDPQQIQAAMQMGQREFEQMFERLMADKARRAY